MVYEKELTEGGLFNLKRRKLEVGILLSPSTASEWLQRRWCQRHTVILQQARDTSCSKGKPAGCLRKAVKSPSLEIFKTLRAKP